MKPCLLLTFLLAAGVAQAGVARKQTAQDFRAILGNSPFTLKPAPPVPTGRVEENPLKDWMLKGVSPLGRGEYMVTICNKKDKSDEVNLIKGSTKKRFSLVSVQPASDPKETTVKVKYSGKVYTVGMDLKALGVPNPKPNVLPAGAKRTTSNNKKPPSGARPPIPTNGRGGNSGGRRSRVVTPNR